MQIRKATTADVEQICALVNQHADLGEMLHRSTDEIFEILRDFFVAVEDGRIAGCSALHVMDRDLAEVRSLVVSPDVQGRGIGKELVDCCIGEARSLGIARVFALTAKPRHRAHWLPQSASLPLPQKNWKDCSSASSSKHSGSGVLFVLLGRGTMAYAQLHPVSAAWQRRTAGAAQQHGR